MRYLPGGIWGYASRVVEARRLGVGKGVAALSLTVELAITALSWGIVAVTGVLVSGLGFELLAKVLPGEKIIWIAAAGMAGAVCAGIGWWKFGDRIRYWLQG